MHIAHKTLIDEAEAIVIIERNSGYLTSGFRRSYFVDKPCHFYHFDSIKGLSPKAFINKLKIDFPCLEKIVVGYDFHFGKNKAGDATLLRTLCKEEVLVIDEVCLNGISVHSRTIKKAITLGNIPLANSLLGREYHIEGHSIRGQGLGKKSLVATINIEVEEYVLPLAGVYATHTQIGNISYQSVSFLGHRISTDGRYAIETHLLDQELEIFNTKIKLTFVDFIRENEQFKNLNSLKVQISHDIITAKERLNA
jgi:riboflavin kinase/FMN adenylyltransferase